MKTFNVAVIALTLLTFFSACKKDSSTTPSTATPIEGTFTGKYGFGNDNPDKSYTLSFKSNGVIQEIGQASGSATGEGTWKLNGNKLTASYKMLFTPFNDYFVNAVFDAGSGSLSGTWGYESGGTDGGKFTLYKK